jgi:putative glutamine amidotransferase
VINFVFSPPIIRNPVAHYFVVVLYGRTFLLVSSHHQSSKALGKGFEITAHSPDRMVIEGLAHDQYPYVFAVQFHPEVPALYTDMESWKFEPGDEPRTMHQIIGKDGVRFHKKYWSYISGIVNSF